MTFKKPGERMKKINGMVLLGLVLCSTVVVCLTAISCGDNGSNMYWPLGGSKQWQTDGWAVKDRNGVAVWDHKGYLATKGTYDNQDGTWDVIEVGESSDYGEVPYMDVFLRFDGDTIEVLGISSVPFSGSEAEITKPDSGVLEFDLSDSSVGSEQHSEFNVVDASMDVKIKVDVSVKSRGESLNASAGSFSDVMELDVNIYSSANPWGDQQVQVWLAKGYGPIRAMKTEGQVTTGGDFVLAP